MHSLERVKQPGTVCAGIKESAKYPLPPKLGIETKEEQHLIDSCTQQIRTYSALTDILHCAVVCPAARNDHD